VNSKERKARIGDRIDQIPHKMTPGGHNLVVLAAEWDDLQTLPISREPHDAVAVKSSAVDRKIRLNHTARRFNGDLSRGSLDALDGALRQDLPAAGLDEFRVLPRDRGVIRDAFSRNLERGNTGAMRLQLTQSLDADHVQAA